MTTAASASQTGDLERAILARLGPGIHERLRLIDGDEAATIDPDRVAGAMLNALPTRHPFTGLGPFYDTTGLTRWLGISRQALHQKVKTNQVLACTTGDGQRVYPAWQFTTDGRALTGLPQVLRVLLEATDPWTVAIWLSTPTDRLDEGSAVNWLAARRDPTPVLDAAREDAARWAE